MCRVLCVSTSGFYAWGKRAPGPRAQRTERIRKLVSRVFEQSNRIYGSHKIAQKLTDDEDLETACRNMVAKVMNEMGLKSRVVSKFTPTTTTTDPDKIPAPTCSIKCSPLRRRIRNG